ncbi:MAG TPA: glycoside hydrolase family 88 protein, partial [Polyangia bacterium]
MTALFRRRAGAVVAVMFAALTTSGCSQSDPPAQGSTGSGGVTSAGGSGGSRSGSGGRGGSQAPTNAGGSTGAGGSQPSGAGGSGGSVAPQADAAPTNDVAQPTSDAGAEAGKPDAMAPTDAANAAIDPAVVAIMRRVADWQIPRMGTAKSWVHCVGWSGIMATHFLTKDPKYLQATVTWGGNWQLVAPNEPRGDVQCAAQAFYDSYLADPKPENMVRVNTSKPHLDAVVNGNLRGRVEWWWQDALFMVAPGFARLGTITGDKKYFDVLNRMWWDTYEYLWSPQNNLMYRDNNLRNRFWSRGNGWVVGAIARVLQH